MKNINKHLFTFAGISAFLGLVLLLLLQKFLPVFFLHTVYYCQEFIHTYSIQLPPQINIGIFGLLALFLLAFFTKISIIFFKIRHLRKELQTDIKSQQQFTYLIRALGLKEKVCFVKNHKPFAFCLGIRNPRIYISSKLTQIMTVKELEVVLLHEKYHLENRDTLIMLIAQVGEFIFPFFPLFSELLHKYKIDRELRADRKALQNLENKDVLISVLKKLLAFPTLSPAFIAAIGDSTTLEARIETLMQKHQARENISIKNILISMLSLTVLIAVLAAPVHAIEVHSSKQDAMMVCLEGDTCASWCKKHNTVIPYSSKPSNLSVVSRTYSPVW